MHKAVFAARRLAAFTAIRTAAHDLSRKSPVQAPELSAKPPLDPRRRETWWLKQLETIAVFLGDLVEELPKE